MAAPRRIAVLDIGKTNVKVALHDLAEARDVELRRMPNEVRRDGHYPHFDVAAIWDFFLASLQDLARRGTVDAISVTAHGATLALIDADGGLALPVLDYEHSGPDAMADAYAAVRPPFAETFSARLPGGLNAGAQLFWQERAFPADFARVRTILTYPQYWAFRLTGVAACEVTSLGCHTDLWRPAEGGYSSLIARMGWADRMAPVRPAFQCLGPVLPDLAARTGLSPATPVFCGLHDSNASLLPHLGQAAPFSVVSTGTWVVVFAVGGALAGLDESRDTLANVDAFGRAVPSGRFMGGREFEILSGGMTATADDAATAGVIARGIGLSAGWSGATGPFPAAVPRWTVDPESLAPAERAAAIGLYLALMTDEILRLTGAGGPTIVEGPLGRNDVFVRGLAGLTGRAMHVVEGATGTTHGAALLAAGAEIGATDLPDAVAIPPWAAALPGYRDRFRALCAGQAAL